MQQWHHFNPTRSKFSMLTSFYCQSLKLCRPQVISMLTEQDVKRKQKQEKKKKAKYVSNCYLGVTYTVVRDIT